MKKLVLGVILSALMAANSHANLDNGLPRLYIGSTIGYGSTTAKLTNKNTTVDGQTFIGDHDTNVSILGGYGLFINEKYLGVEIGYTFSNDNILSNYGKDFMNGKYLFQLKRKGYANGSILFGHLLNSTTMAYLRAGANYSKWSINDSLTANFDINNPALGTSNSLSFVPGVGLETEFDAISMRLEYICEFGRNVRAKANDKNIAGFSNVTNIRNQATKIGIVVKF